MKIYLSGPMTGYTDDNFPEFNRIAKALRARGFDVVNPAEINPGTAPVDDETARKAFYNQCLRADLREMMDCEAIVLMKGWEKSVGANLELHVAHRVGMSVLFADDLLMTAANQCGLCGARDTSHVCTATGSDDSICFFCFSAWYDYGITDREELVRKSAEIRRSKT